MIGVRKKVGAVALSAAVALACSPVAAFAAPGDDLEPSVTHGAAGSTDVYVQLKMDPDKEVHEDSANLRFKIPTEIDFVADADGVLYGPNCWLDNESIFGIHATAMTSKFQDDWTGKVLGNDGKITATAAERNAAGFTIGPAADKLDAKTHEVVRNDANPTAGNVTAGKETSWNMRADGTLDTDGTTELDKVQMTTTGAVKNLDADIWTDKVKFCTLTWYVKPGVVS